MCETAEHLVLYNDFPGVTESITYEEAENQIKSVFQLLQNEIIDFYFPYQLQITSDNPFKLYATNWALRCIFTNPIKENSLLRHFVIPLKTIFKIEEVGSEEVTMGKFGVKFHFSSGGHLTIQFPNISGLRRAFIQRVESLKKTSFQYEERVWTSNPSWLQHLHSVSRDYKMVKNDFCDSYPLYFLLPSSSPSFLAYESSLLRSRSRFPIVSYFYLSSGEKVALLRSSQPLNGLSKLKNNFEQQYLSEVCNGHPLTIVDCRPKKDAFAYQFLGKGYESLSDYKEFIPDVSFHFLGIPHAYKVRKWYIEMLEMLFECNDSACKKWTELFFQLVESASFVVDNLLRQRVVLVHCSDGWDRTSQICALSQLMIDPYFRTLSGFIELVQKDWIDMGHTFSNRCGHAQCKDFNETSPIFAQFIDCVAQLMLKYPFEFEFNLKFLDLILANAYAQIFGDFLGNNFIERIKMKRPPSLFDCLNDEKYGIIDKVKNMDFSPDNKNAVLHFKRNENYTFFPQLLGTPVFFSDDVPLITSDPPPIPDFKLDDIENMAEIIQRREGISNLEKK